MTQCGTTKGNARADKLLELVTAAAAEGRAAPANAEMASFLGLASEAAAGRVLKRLEDRGDVTVQRFINTRIITITSTGQSTAAVPVNLSQPRRDRSAREDYQPEHATAPADRIKRDPCPLCGVRGDIDCSHKRTARPILFVPASFHRAEVAQL